MYYYLLFTQAQQQAQQQQQPPQVVVVQPQQPQQQPSYPALPSADLAEAIRDAYTAWQQAIASNASVNAIAGLKLHLDSLIYGS